MEYDYTDTDHTDSNRDNDNDDDDQLELDIPDWAMCPLTLEIMNDPLMDRDGLNYERKAIVEWLNRGHSTCPLTRKPLSYRMLAPNAQLKLRLDNWRLQHNQPVITLDKEYEQEGCKFSILLGSALEMNFEDAVVAHLLEQRATASLAALHQETSRRERRRPGRSARRRRNQSQTTSRGTATANGTSSGNNDPASISPRSRRRSVLSILDSALSVVTSSRN